MNRMVDENVAERYREISKYLLLNDGTPSNWGQNSQLIPETIGFAKTGSSSYDLDIDKVSRLNIENLYALSYAQMFTALKMPDVSFRIEIKPIFEVYINLTRTYVLVNTTVYQFEILTQKHGVPVQVELNCYVIAENYFGADYTCTSNSRTCLNITLSNDVTGPALLVVFSRFVSNTKIVSFNTYAFAHNSAESKPKGTFLRLSPLDYSLTASFIYSGISLSRAYALTFNYNSILTQISNSSQSALYDIPHFLDSSPTLIVITGWNSTVFFTEWTVYPQIPLQAGVGSAGLTALSNVFAYTYIVVINSVIYECTIWLGGPRD